MVELIDLKTDARICPVLDFLGWGTRSTPDFSQRPEASVPLV